VIERNHGDLEKFIQNSLPGMKREMVDSKIILMQISTGLSYLLEKGIVHRNLKAQNILLQLMNIADHQWNVLVGTLMDGF
jgi:serine/threonine protein kinase